MQYEAMLFIVGESTYAIPYTERAIEKVAQLNPDGTAEIGVPKFLPHLLIDAARNLHSSMEVAILSAGGSVFRYQPLTVN